MDTMFAELQETVRETGIWNGEQERSHAFQLSPDVYELGSDQLNQLNQLAPAIDEVLGGISRIVAISEQPDLCGKMLPYGRIGNTLKQGTPYKLPNNRPRNLPILRKCDLLIDEQGHIWLAEIDATNPRSWGYSIIGRRICQVLRPEAAQLPGVAAYIAAECRRRRIDAVTFLFGDTQRFYEPEFAIIARELKLLGIEMAVINELQVDVHSGVMRHARTGEVLPPTLIDMPPMNYNKPLIDWLRAGLKSGTLQCLISPKHFLASKSLLGVVSNAVGDPAIEALVRSQISESALRVVRSHLPMTHIIGRDWTTPQLSNHHGLVLKQSVASGMRGIYFGDEPEFGEALLAASRQRGANILQREVTNRRFAWQRFDERGQLDPPGEWQLRLTAYFSRTGVEDIAITARPNKAVHGAKDAILTGTVLV
ncbi:hypothetical protein IT414_02190 [bacterium]|nr:hypothetical protein [bacterium]